MRVISEYDKKIANLILPGDSRLEDPFYSAMLRIKFMFASLALVSLKSFIKVEVVGWHEFVENKKHDFPYVLAIWHGSLPLPIMECRGLPYAVMDSPSADGDLLLKLFNFFGYYTVRGSSHKRSVAGLLEHIKAVKKSGLGATSVDGPKGPEKQTKPGIVMLSKKTGAKIVAIGCAFSNCYTLKRSWDHARFPLPFSRAVLYASEPFELDKNMNIDDACKFVNDKIIEAHDQAEKYLKQNLRK